MSQTFQPELDFSAELRPAPNPETFQADPASLAGATEPTPAGVRPEGQATGPVDPGWAAQSGRQDRSDEDLPPLWNLEAGSAQSPKSQTLILRGRPGAVTRFRKGLVVGLAIGLCLSAMGLTSFALRDRKSKAVPPPPPESSSAKVAPAGLTGLPRDYAGSPALGPPASFQEALSGTDPAPDLTVAPAAGDVSPGQVPAPDAGAAQAHLAPASALLMPTTLARGLEVKAADLDGQEPAATGLSLPLPAQTSTDQRIEPSTPRTHRLAAGAIIAAQLLTGLNSESPGPVIAQVAADIYDSQTGRYRLIPAGSKLLGVYEPATSPGQSRISLVFKTLVLPSGQEIALADAQASDRQGFGGLTDQVDRHGARIFVDTTLLGVAGLAKGDLGARQDDDVAVALRRALGDGTSRAADALLERAVRQGPSLRVRPGWPLRLILQHALELEGEWNP